MVRNGPPTMLMTLVAVAQQAHRAVERRAGADDEGPVMEGIRASAQRGQAIERAAED